MIKNKRLSGSAIVILILLFVGNNCAHSPRAQDSEETSQKTSPTTLTLVSINDFHGYLQPPEGQIKTSKKSLRAGGIPQMAAYIDNLREKRKNVLFVSSGDLIGASPLISSAFHDEPTIRAFNRMDMFASAVGNHEFDEGVEELQRIQNGECHPEDGCEFTKSYPGASFQYLAANVIDRSSGEPIFPAYATKRINGTPVAFVGIVTRQTDSLVMPSGIRSVKFKNEAKVLNRVTEKLKKKGVETIIALIHKGGVPQNKTPDISDCGDMKGSINETIKKSSDEIDIFITGHSHQTYICRIDDRLVTSAMSYGRLVTEIKLDIDPKTKDVIDTSAKNVAIPAEGPTDESLRQFVSKADTKTEKISERVVGHVTRTMSNEPDKSGESIFGRLIADAQLAATSGKKGSADIALMNSGGIRTSVGNPNLKKDGTIPVRFKHLHEAQPFGNNLVTVTLTGQQLHDMLEDQWSGSGRKSILQPSKNLRYSWDPTAKPGKRVKLSDIQIDGKPIEVDRDYRVTVNNFLANGGDGFKILTKGTNRVIHGRDVNALANYLEKHSPVEPPKIDRIIRKSSKQNR